MESKASMSTLMIGTPQVLGTNDMKGYNQQVSTDTNKQKASYT
jgi:hypothetical protein